MDGVCSRLVKRKKCISICIMLGNFRVGENMADLEADGRVIKTYLKEIEWMCGFSLSLSGLYAVAVFCECGK